MKTLIISAAALFAAGVALAVVNDGVARGACTSAEKTRAQRAVAAYAAAMPKQRAGYFKSHKRSADRARFVRRQKQQLAKLRAAAACKLDAIPTPPPPTTTTPATPDAACTPSLSAGGAGQPNEGPTNRSLYFRSLGTVRAVALYVDFSDAPTDETTQQVYDWTIPQAVAWFPEVSYGRFTMQVTPVHKWVRMPKPSTEYRNGPSANVFADAVAAADATVDFSGVDLVLLAVSHGSRVTATYSFPSASADGNTIRYGVIIGDHNRASTLGSVMTSDLGRLMGLPELADVTHPTDPATGAGFEEFIGLVGRWSVMSDPHPHNHFLGWEKWKLGWIDAEQIHCLSAAGSHEFTLTPTETAGGLKLVVVPTSTSTAYAIEVRRPMGMDSLDCDQGVLVYTIDAAAASGHGGLKVLPVAPGAQCGPRSNAVLDLGAGQVSTFEDTAVKIELLSTDSLNATVRVTRR